MEHTYKYDVAISFGEEDRNAALALSLALELRGIKKVYYYPNRQGLGWGEDLQKKLIKIYRDEARFAVILFSKNYFDPEKKYTWTEMRAIEARMKINPKLVYMYPVRLYEDAALRAYPNFEKLKCLEWNYNPKLVAKELENRLGGELTSDKRRARPQSIIYSSGDNALFIIGGRQKNFTQNIINGNGH
jgi:hypothetical protein